MSSERILLVAYQCAPGQGSVSQIGWEWYSRLSAEQPVTLVTHVRNREALTAAKAPLRGSEILFIDTEWFAGPLYRIARRLFPKSEHSVFLLSSLDYFLFDLSAYRQLRARLAASQCWHLLHRVTPVTLAAPTWLARLGIPSVIGPLNSGLTDPQGFGQIMKQESTWLIRLREFGRLVDAAIGSTRCAARLLVATRATLNAVAPRHHERCRMMAENGVDLARFTPTPWPAPPKVGQPLRILFVGRLVPVKGVDMLLSAVARLRQTGRQCQLDIVGDGPMRATWQHLSNELGLATAVRFHGAQPTSDVARHMADCHVFCLPSVRESGGAVLLEAMASARPVIALDFGGPGEVVSAQVGALLPMRNPEQVVADLAATLDTVFKAPADWERRGQEGRRAVELLHSWPAKIAAARETYREVIAEWRPSCY